MKRKLLFLAFILISAFANAQFPLLQYLGSDSTMVKSRGGLQGRFAPIPFTDTAAANLSRISQYPGALIYTSGVDKYWYRNATTTGWIEFTSSGGSTVNVYNSDGTLTGARILSGGNNSLTFDELVGFDVTSTSGAIQFNFFKSDGKSSYFVLGDTIKINPNLGNLLIDTLIETQDTSTYKPIVVDPITGRVLQSSYWYGSGGGGSTDTTSLSNRINAKADSSNVWKTTGTYNTSPASNYIGTADLNPLVFKVNNIHAGFLTARAEPTSAGSGSVVLGQYAGQTLDTNNGANTLIGHGAGAKIKYNPLKANQNTFIGLWAGYWTKYHSDPFGGRSTLVGQSAGFWNYDGSSLTGIGTFALEMNNRGNNLTGIGRDALRSNIDGSYNTGVGSLSLLYNTTGVKTIAVTNGGSGYTTATVTVSAPPGPTPGVAWGTATATATISGGVITGITVTDPGAGYSINYADSNSRHPIVTVTITGDGTGAAASVTETYSATGNTALGHGSGYLNKYGNYNIELGYLTTLNTWGDYNILMGYGAGAGSTAPTVLLNSVAIGKNSRVSRNNTMALGGMGADTINVGINTDTARKKLDVVGGDILVHEHTIGRGPGSVATNTVFGTRVIANNTTALGNTVMGYEAAANGTVSSANVFIGYRAANSANYAGTGNIIVGYEAAYLNRANESVAIGLRSMYNQGSNGSVGVGAYTLYNNVRNTSVGRAMNTAIGDYSYYSYTGSASNQTNTGVGAYSGYGITTGSYNTSMGALSMGKGFSSVGTPGSSGSYNTSLGYASLYYQNNSSGNIGIGSNAFNTASFNPSIGYNIGIGYSAGNLLTTGNYNVILGGNSGVSIAEASHHVIISDGEGNIKFTADSVGNTAFYGTGGHKFQSGTTAQRPTNVAGVTRWNTDSSALEYADGSSWFTIGASAGGGSGTVTSVGTGYGLSGGTITTSGTILVDSASLSPYYLRRKDSLTSSNLLGYVTRTVLADTAAAIRSAIGSSGVTTIATINGTTKSANGAVISGANLYMQTVDGTYPGLMTSAQKARLDSNSYLTIDKTYDSLAWDRNDSVRLTKSLRVQLNGVDVGKTITDSTLSYNITGTFGNDSAYVNAYLTVDSTALILVRDNNGQDTFHFRVDTTGWQFPNIYNTDGTLTGARILSGGNNSLTFDELVGFDVTSTSGAIQYNYFNSGKGSYFILSDTTKVLPSLGNFMIDSLQSGASTDSVLVYSPTTGMVKYINASSFDQQADTTTVPLITFTAGAGFAADTAMVTDSSLFGSLFTGQYEYTITKIQAVIKGNSGDSVVLMIVYNDSFNVLGTKVTNAGLSVSSRVFGNTFDVYTNRTVPANQWLWMKPEAVIAGKKPKYISVTLLGYKTYVAP